MLRGEAGIEEGGRQRYRSLVDVTLTDQLAL